jgi:hypothetical protein
MPQKYMPSATPSEKMKTQPTSSSQQNDQTQPGSIKQTDQTANTPGSGCPTQYEGTYQGAIDDSGELEHITYRQDGQKRWETPFTARYDFKMTVKCLFAGDIPTFDKDGIWSDWEPGYYYSITYVRPSDPGFGCAAGCTPVYNDDLHSEVWVNKAGTGGMEIFFPNGAEIRGFSTGPFLQFKPDQQRLELRITGKGFNSIGAFKGDDDYYKYIEEMSCEKPVDVGDRCEVDEQFPNTIILYKIS